MGWGREGERKGSGMSEMCPWSNFLFYKLNANLMENYGNEQSCWIHTHTLSIFLYCG